ncbi:tripartite tricarboxylate transporter substrate binding protein [Ramlibacter sp.]|uniref:Bug family tripartite tricarboxylate transporter substrate binding protein n=1 Tax=Ramlibacter sp. TaxID=1917967 RepID=UPI001836D8ED|nr:tripartite tricarboxylate transporter substrate binding protein [Ramlibacter sp.]MBA2672394.1 tripartite tricarboxylate transporter substrate binding protein [Ramlibacter sp.]
MHRSMRAVLRCLTHAAVIAASAAGGTAFAQAAYPSKPIKWIVGYPPGGGTDYLARTVATQMAEQLKQPIVIDNKPGAAGMIGADAAAKAEPDGYTVFTADNGILVYNPALYKKISYNPERDFAPLGLIARVPLIVVAAPSANIKTAADFADNLKRNPGRLSYASPGNGSPHHLAMELLKNQAGLFVVHVPYRGAAPAMQDVMGGQVPLMVVDASSAMTHIKSGKLVPLLHFSAKRMAQLPDVPTAMELGYKGVEAYAWQGLVVPAATPQPVRERLSREMQAAVANPAVRKKLADAGWDPIQSDGQLMSVYTMAETRKWHKLIKDRGITVE